MNKSNEAQARKVIQSLRPQAIKNGLGPTIVNFHISQHLPEKLRSLSRKKWKNCSNYQELREEAEYYRPPFNPDLSEFYGSSREIIVYEIEDKLAVSSEKEEAIKWWVGTMDGWDQWHLLVIITNRFGLGWDIVLDTKRDLCNFWLARFRNNRTDFLRTYPDLTSEQIIVTACKWKNWSWPTLKKFNEARSKLKNSGQTNPPAI